MGLNKNLNWIALLRQIIHKIYKQCRYYGFMNKLYRCELCGSIDDKKKVCCGKKMKDLNFKPDAIMTSLELVPEWKKCGL